MTGGLKKLWEHVKNLAAMLKAIHANALQRIMKGIRHSPRVIGAFPDGYSAIMLIEARLRHISTTKWGTDNLRKIAHNLRKVT